MAGDDLRAGDVVAGRYRIARLIGSGGMGAVYEAEQIALGRMVALKVTFDDDETALVRFEREARALAKIRHPNVVGVVDFLREGRSSFLVMELLEGESLLDRISRDAPLAAEVVIDVTANVLRGLAAIHEHGIVHRDLKPSNVFLAKDGVKIVDFGIAKVLGDTSLTTTGAGGPIGTPSFLAPEQLRGEDPDARTDLHALGVCMFAMLTKQYPWTTRMPSEVAAEILRDERRAVSEVRGDVSAHLDRIVQRALAKERSHRFASANEMLAALLAQADATDRIDRTERMTPRALPAIETTTPMTQPTVVATAPMPIQMPRPAAGARARAAPPPNPPVVRQAPSSIFLSPWFWSFVLFASFATIVVLGYFASSWSHPPPPPAPTMTSDPIPAPPAYQPAPPVEPPVAIPVSAASSAPPPAPPPHVFRADELAKMRRGRVAAISANGDRLVMVGSDCACFEIDVVRGKKTEAVALRCPDCTLPRLNGSPSCRGADENDEFKDGLRMCREYGVVAPR